nr:MAG TPA: hypothetical protein [Caudoviricetes sp.]
MKIKLQCGDSIPILKECRVIIEDGNIVLEKKEHKFKSGDVLRSIYKNTIVIFKEYNEDTSILFHSYYNTDCKGNEGWISTSFRHATEEEKQCLFDKMREQNLYWDAKEKQVKQLRWRAEYGQDYYFIINGTVSIDIDINHKSDVSRYESGNYFRTEKQAREALNRVNKTLIKYHEEIGE